MRTDGMKEGQTDIYMTELKFAFHNFANEPKNTTNFFFPAVSYGRETLSFTLRKERGLGVFGNRVLTKLCGTKRKEGKGG